MDIQWGSDARESVTTADLLGRYRAGSDFFFSTARHTLLATGVHLPVEPDGAAGDVTQRVASALKSARSAGLTRPLAVGALAFRDSTPPELYVPRHTRWADATRVQRAPRRPGPALLSAVPEPDAEEYRQRVRMALERMTRRRLDKVVLARAIVLTLPTPVDVTRLLSNLMAADPEGYAYAMPLGGRGGRTLVGSSPELLVSRSGRAIVANPLAGSAPRGADAAQDRRNALALLASAKDRYEHALVVEAVEGALRPYCRTLTVPASPSLLGTGAVWHLSTRIHGRLDDPAVASTDLAAALHPTPAVCGSPAPAASAAIQEIEGDARGYYTGAVGWCDATGDGEWALTIRCGEVAGRTVRLFAGAGVVPGSRPDGELAETTAKFGTLLRALDLDTAL